MNINICIQQGSAICWSYVGFTLLLEFVHLHLSYKFSLRIWHCIGTYSMYRNPVLTLYINIISQWAVYLSFTYLQPVVIRKIPTMTEIQISTTNTVSKHVVCPFLSLWNRPKALQEFLTPNLTGFSKSPLNKWPQTIWISAQTNWPNFRCHYTEYLSSVLAHAMSCWANEWSRSAAEPKQGCEYPGRFL